MASQPSIPGVMSLFKFTLKNNESLSGVIHMLEDLCIFNMLRPFLV